MDSGSHGEPPHRSAAPPEHSLRFPLFVGKGPPTPPKGVILTSYDQVKANLDTMKTSVETNYMPLGNLTKMTPEERQMLVQWIVQGAHFP